jgi:hypothetical protein
MSTTDRDIVDLKLSAMRALLGNVTANLAGVAVHFEQRRIVLSAFFFAEPDKKDKHGVEDAATLVVADFQDRFTIETRLWLISETYIEAEFYRWVFLRAEVQAR